MADLGSAYLRVMPDTSGLNARMAGYFRSSDWGKLGKTAGVALGAGIAAGGAAKALYEVGQAFDDAYDKIRVQTGATGKELGKLKTDFREVLGSVPTDFATASKAIAGLNQRLDITGKPLQKLTKQFTELSRITETDVEGNITSVTRAFGDWEVKTRDQAKTLDFFFRASQASGASVSELTDLIVQFGAPLRRFGFTVEEATSMFGLFEKAGVNIQTMIPGLKLALSEFLAAGRDPEKALQKTFEGIADGSIKAADAIDIFGKRAGADMVEAIEQGRFKFEEFTKVISDGDDTIRKAGRQTMDFSEHWLKFKNNVLLVLEPIATRVFEGIGDAMKDITAIMSDKDLTSGEKWDKFATLATDAISKAVPKLLEAGKDAAVAVIKGFLDSGIWGQLAVGAVVMKALGGLGGPLGKAGGAAGSKFGAGFKAGLARFGLAAVIIGAFEAVDRFVNNWGERTAQAFGERFAEPLSRAIQNKSIPAMQRLREEANKTAAAVRELGWRGADEAAEKIEKLGDTATDMLPTIKSIRQSYERAFDLGDLKQQHRSDLATITANFGKHSEEAKAMSELTNHTLARHIGDMISSGKISMNKGERFLESFGLTLDDLHPRFRTMSGKARDAFNEVTGGSKKMGRSVASNVSGMVGEVSHGLDLLKGNTNKALKAFGVKALNFDIKTGSSSGSQQPGGGAWTGQRGGPINMGAPSGDSVPAMLERGEYVLNRKAVAAMGKQQLDAINFGVAKRFAKGGMAGGFNVDGAKPGFVPFMNYLNSMYGPLYVMSGLRLGSITTSGNLSNHATGNAVDISTLQGGLNTATNAATLNATGAAASRMDALHAFMAKNINLPGDFLWRTFTGGNHYNHIHRGITSAEADSPERMMQYLSALPKGGGFGATLKRILLKGPDGPLKDMGQGALDKSWKAAKALLSRKMSTPTFGTGPTGGPLHGGTYGKEALVKLWRQANDGLGSSNLMAAIALAESSGNPGVTNSIGARGLWQIIPSTAAAFGLNYGKLTNPLYNAKGAGAILRGQGLGAWEAYTTGAHAQYLAKGGSTDMTGGHPIPKNLGERLGKFRNKLRRGLAHIAKTDERIQIAEALASLDSSPGGSGLSGSEKAKQIGLYESLMGQLSKQRRIAAQGLALSGKFGKPATDFRDALTEMAGLTGKGGRIFDTSLALAGLKGTPLAGASGLSIADLLRLKEAFSYGLFPTMHSGGVVPGPVGQNVPIMAQGGEVVSPVGAQTVIYSDIYVGDECIARKVRHEIRESDRAGHGFARAGVLR